MGSAVTKLPVIRGTIDRRILVNYRVRPEAIARVLPPPFRPKLVDGWAIAGICLIRLKQVRPPGVPAPLGVTSENAAHRIAVEWDDLAAKGVPPQRSGVFIPRRDSSSCINTALGGRLFPGVHHHAHFDVQETDRTVSLSMRGDGVRVDVEGEVTEALPAGSIFPSLAAASAFFESGSLGYSPARRPGTFDGLELRVQRWHVEPLQVRKVRSSFFEDSKTFSAGDATFDCALLMRNIDHEWHAGEPICACEPQRRTA
jgi:hypothetical protein